MLFLLHIPFTHWCSSRRILTYVAKPGTPNLRNLALADPIETYFKKKFLRHADNFARTKKWFLYGVIMAFRLGDGGRGKQICMAPEATTFHRAVAVLGASMKVSELGFYSFMNGLSFSTLLETNGNFQVLFHS